MNTKKRRILLLEDDPEDVWAFRREVGDEYEIVVARDEGAFKAALAGEPFDCFVADFRVGTYDGLSALKYVRKMGFNLPAILLTGTMSDAQSAQMLDEGFSSAMTKSHKAQLRSAIRIACDQRVHTQKERARERLEAMGLLAGGMAHDSNNCL